MRTTCIPWWERSILWMRTTWISWWEQSILWIRTTWIPCWERSILWIRTTWIPCWEQSILRMRTSWIPLVKTEKNFEPLGCLGENRVYLDENHLNTFSENRGHSGWEPLTECDYCYFLYSLFLQKNLLLYAQVLILPTNPRLTPDLVRIKKSDQIMELKTWIPMLIHVCLFWYPSSLTSIRHRDKHQYINPCFIDSCNFSYWHLKALLHSRTYISGAILCIFHFLLLVYILFASSLLVYMIILLPQIWFKVKGDGKRISFGWYIPQIQGPSLPPPAIVIQGGL